jgi:hypothetical protein
VAQLVARFNRRGLAALDRRYGGGPPVQYGTAERERILAEFQRPPDREQDGTATWSLTTLQRALPRAPDGLPTVSTFTIFQTLHAAGYTVQANRTWCQTGTAKRKRKDGTVKTVIDPLATPKKELIEHAYRVAEALGLPLWCMDEAGPYQAIPQPGGGWSPQGRPRRRPHEFVRGGTAKLLTLFRPATGELRAEPVLRAPNAVLHPWLECELTPVLAASPPPSAVPVPGTRWSDWHLVGQAPLPADLPLLRRLLLVWDNPAGHHTPAMVQWCLAHGILPLYTPIAGSWLNMAESVQRILVRRALAGQHPQTAQQVMDWLAQAVRGWNADPTPFVWGGKRAARRQRARERRPALGGSGATTRRPLCRGRASACQRHNGYAHVK